MTANCTCSYQKLREAMPGAPPDSLVHSEECPARESVPVENVDLPSS